MDGEALGCDGPTGGDWQRNPSTALGAGMGRALPDLADSACDGLLHVRRAVR